MPGKHIRVTTEKSASYDTYLIIEHITQIKNLFHDAVQKIEPIESQISLRPCNNQF